MENASLGMHVVQTRASDLDDDARVRYVIVSGDPDGDFSVGDHDGLIVVARHLDYERRNSYRLVVRAEDSSGGSGVASQNGDNSATVVVTVVDVNDNLPRFPDLPYSCRVRENAPSVVLTRPIFVATAVDRDDPPFDRVEYSLR